MTGTAVRVQITRLVIWWALLFAGWWALVGEWSFSDLVWGASLALLAAAAGVFVTSTGMVRGTALTASLKVAPSVAAAVLLDFGVVMGVLATALLGRRRDSTGTFQQRQMRSRDARSPARRSWLTLASTFSPNAYVIDLDNSHREALLHELRPHRFSERPL